MNRNLLVALSLLFLLSVSGCTAETHESSKIDIITACERLVAYYPIPRDTLDGPAYGGLFASDGEFVLRGVQTKGRENIVEQFLARANEQTTRHVTGSINVTKVNDTAATGISYALVYQAQTSQGDQPHALDERSLLAVVSYEDVFSFNGEQCFFDKRTVNLDFLRGSNDQ